MIFFFFLLKPSRNLFFSTSSTVYIYIYIYIYIHIYTHTHTHTHTHVYYVVVYKADKIILALVGIRLPLLSGLSNFTVIVHKIYAY
jgi:hypothetical protein